MGTVLMIGYHGLRVFWSIWALIDMLYLSHGNQCYWNYHLINDDHGKMPGVNKTAVKHSCQTQVPAWFVLHATHAVRLSKL